MAAAQLQGINVVTSLTVAGKAQHNAAEQPAAEPEPEQAEPEPALVEAENIYGTGSQPGHASMAGVGGVDRKRLRDLAADPSLDVVRQRLMCAMSMAALE